MGYPYRPAMHESDLQPGDLRVEVALYNENHKCWPHQEEWRQAAITARFRRAQYLASRVKIERIKPVLEKVDKILVGGKSHG